MGPHLVLIYLERSFFTIKMPFALKSSKQDFVFERTVHFSFPFVYSPAKYQVPLLLVQVTGEEEYHIEYNVHGTDTKGGVGGRVCG